MKPSCFPFCQSLGVFLLLSSGFLPMGCISSTLLQDFSAWVFGLCVCVCVAHMKRGFIFQFRYQMLGDSQRLSSPIIRASPVFGKLSNSHHACIGFPVTFEAHKTLSIFVCELDKGWRVNSSDYCVVFLETVPSCLSRVHGGHFFVAFCLSSSL